MKVHHASIQFHSLRVKQLSPLVSHFEMAGGGILLFQCPHPTTLRLVQVILIWISRIVSPVVTPLL